MVRLTFFVPKATPETVEIPEPTELTVGRSEACGFRIQGDPMVSRMHAVIMVKPPLVQIKDLNSTNGMSINGTPSRTGDGEPQEAVELRDGDEVSIGATRIVVSVGMGEEAGGNRDASAAAPAFSDTRRITGGRQAVMLGRGVGADETVSGMAPILPVVPGYRPMRLLASGQAGETYLAVSDQDGKTVALKVFSPGMGFSRKMLDDFRGEAESAARIRHPHIAGILGSGRIGAQGVFLVMEYVRGQNLAKHLGHTHDGRLPFAAAYPMMLHLAGALCMIHANGMVHLDLKPSSVIVGTDGAEGLKATLTDMGGAYFADIIGLGPRAEAALSPGRLAYLPPEEFGPIGESKAQSDVFSLSAIFYEMLAGRPPYDFSGDAPREEVVANARITPIEEVVSGLPEPLVVVIERGLSPDPDARYGSGCDLLEALENIRV